MERAQSVMSSQSSTVDATLQSPCGMSMVPQTFGAAVTRRSLIWVRAPTNARLALVTVG